ncbi:2-polyprenyl-6-methoxyphenol hydroxylase-like FAD-dependent oxidoreductase [Sphingobium subterraneum]|uniref:2-polyprenyl-6-methoxyphenol hydroxylase-like FAD-dependent oxidoreductase n=2 Tax=Sphingobium subterraneum TaxID=627688 RepID=A0A841IXS4_9SPHN|nr:2-polyprenyl-6-methoxyphenol hydroxylase-like FAD-dependent oxidoreductase [Sphingobium subterraneum]
MVAGLLFARAGVPTVVLEKHSDFLRDFRGDTVHPSTLELFHELGLVHGLLSRPHDKVSALTAEVDGRAVNVADFSRLPVSCPYIAMMPQWDFLDFVAQSARIWPCFSLRMNAVVEDMSFDGAGRVDGVVMAGGERIGADLVIAADGRSSLVRTRALLPLETIGAPMDIFWFRLPKEPTDDNNSGMVVRDGQIIVCIDRGDYWQAAYVLPKGAADTERAGGLDRFRARVAVTAPVLADLMTTITSWDQVKLLDVALDRLTSWHRPGLLAIGDAAHAMSPIGGVGINLAVQDAVAAANRLAGPMAQGRPVDAMLAGVEKRRMLPTRIIQRGQKLAQDNIIGSVLRGASVRGG